MTRGPTKSGVKKRAILPWNFVPMILEASKARTDRSRRNAVTLYDEEAENLQWPHILMLIGEKAIPKVRTKRFRRRGSVEESGTLTSCSNTVAGQRRRYYLKRLGDSDTPGATSCPSEVSQVGQIY